MQNKIKIKIKKPELTAPAGDWPGLVTAVASGADSVYFGVKGFSMRNLSGNFNISELKKVMDYLHAHNKKGYLALNVFIRNEELKKIKTILTQAKISKVDAIILWDMAVLELAKKIKLNIHISTQASVANFQAFKFYSKLGAKRIILARECTLADIRKIIQEKKIQKIKTQIECFVHGAMCISVSGRCFLSSYTSGKSANRGECLQYCRREFFINDLDNQGQYLIGENYVLSAKDLCTLEFVDQLIESGIESFKIEGRRRAPEYLKVVTQAYRKAIDAYSKGELDKKLKQELKSQTQAVFNRGFSEGFYFGAPENDRSRGLENKYEKIYLGQVRKFFKKISVAEIHLQNEALKKGDELLITGKTTQASFVQACEIQQKHTFVDSAAKGEFVGVKVPMAVKPQDKVFLWLKKTKQREEVNKDEN
ncbi:MAG: peptidase U32 family protein [Candidatus Omnitrophota bacterium]